MISDQQESSNAIEPMKGIAIASYHYFTLLVHTISYSLIEGS